MALGQLEDELHCSSLIVHDVGKKASVSSIPLHCNVKYAVLGYGPGRSPFFQVVSHPRGPTVPQPQPPPPVNLCILFLACGKASYELELTAWIVFFFHSNENVHTLGRLLNPAVSQGADHLVGSNISQKSPFFFAYFRIFSSSQASSIFKEASHTCSLSVCREGGTLSGGKIRICTSDL